MCRGKNKNAETKRTQSEKQFYVSDIWGAAAQTHEPNNATSAECESVWECAEIKTAEVFIPSEEGQGGWGEANTTTFSLEMFVKNSQASHTVNQSAQIMKTTWNMRPWIHWSQKSNMNNCFPLCQLCFAEDLFVHVFCVNDSNKTIRRQLKGHWFFHAIDFTFTAAQSCSLLDKDSDGDFEVTEKK